MWRTPRQALSRRQLRLRLLWPLKQWSCTKNTSWRNGSAAMLWAPLLPTLERTRSSARTAWMLCLTRCAPSPVTTRPSATDAQRLPILRLRATQRTLVLIASPRCSSRCGRTAPAQRYRATAATLCSVFCREAPWLRRRSKLQEELWCFWTRCEGTVTKQATRRPKPAGCLLAWCSRTPPSKRRRLPRARRRSSST
eukprot:Amastigsp_a677610_6.p3 type:complete len:196 gc:universal Amastigsp_a677610_6:1375-788(-)